MKKILVTGGAGFVGSHLCERLVNDGHEVLCLDNFSTGSRRNISHLVASGRLDVIRHDVADPISLACDEIYHLACPASPPQYQRNPVMTIRTAVCGTMTMLDLARDCRARILLASTSEIYGDPLIHPQIESDWGNVNPVGQRACYDEGKRCAEALAVSYAKHYGTSTRIARIFNTYGPRMDERDGRVVSNLVVQALTGNPITIYGTGRQTRAFCYVSDLVEGLLRLMACEPDPGPVNLGNPHEISIIDLADKVRALSGSRVTSEWRELPGDDPRRRRPDISKAVAVLGWQPRVPIDEGLRRTIAYFRARFASRNGTEAMPVTTRPELSGNGHISPSQ